MNYIVITQPFFYDGEADEIVMMFQSGLERLHLRKPEGSMEEYKALIDAIPRCYHPRIVIHDHFCLAEHYRLGGVHVNRRTGRVTGTGRPDPNSGSADPVPATRLPATRLSKSCHSIEEVKECKAHYDYVTLSPIFDSISKKGYCAAFTMEELRDARESGVIDEKVYALGGVTFERIDEVKEMGFGGGVILGDAWKDDIPVVLTVAGSDSSAGAGIQQDLKTMTRCWCYAATVITAITSQNTLGVQGVMAVPADVVESQLRSVFSDLDVKAVKIGMIPNRDVAEVIVRVLEEEKVRRIMPVVCDPVMLSTSGRELMTEDCIAYVVEHLFPLCTLTTPNIPEYEYLVSHFPKEMVHATSLLLKGGHGDGERLTDTLYLHDTDERITFSHDRVETRNLHGTGCTLSSAIASFMAHRHSLALALERAEEVMADAINNGASLSIGHGNGPVDPPLRI